jgi:hypothetical protein
MKNIYQRVGLLMICILWTFVSWGQSKKVSGKITALESGEALPGVSILLKGKTQGASTNEKGEFALVASEGDILVISYVGYIKEEIKIGTATNLSIQLRSDVTSLGEVVVVGYGTQSRRNITSSIGKLEKTYWRMLQG